MLSFALVAEQPAFMGSGLVNLELNYTLNFEFKSVGDYKPEHLLIL